jgi:hypothetical protein
MLKIRNQKSWAELYQRALFEDDSDRLQVRVKEAQQAIRQRAKELWQANSAGHPIDVSERHELEAALYFLNLLQSIQAQRNTINSHWGMLMTSLKNTIADVKRETLKSPLEVEEAVRRRAYEFYEQRGYVDGHDVGIGLSPDRRWGECCSNEPRHKTRCNPPRKQGAGGSTGLLHHRVTYQDQEASFELLVYPHYLGFPYHRVLLSQGSCYVP